MIDRYSRQTLFPPIGKEGQTKLGHSTVVVAGCGALGGIIATALVRAGIGKIKIIDRDFIEYHNLQRQVLFDEDDIKAGLPKAVAAGRHLRRVNSSVEVEGIVADLNQTNIEALFRDTDLVLDGLDNFETRFLINDACLKHRIPWVYGAAVSSYGMTMNVIPDKPPCFRCFASSPKPGTTLTCDTAGVISPAPFVIGSLQTAEAMKILVGDPQASRELVIVDVWENSFNRVRLKPRPDCPACDGRYEFLENESGTRATLLCGQHAMQVRSHRGGDISLEKMATRLRPLGEVSHNEFMLRFVADGHETVVFPDGRAIIKNIDDEAVARGIYAKYIGA
ncbi:MAG: thiazole biosynthesis adenylyltransferase ThiF [Dehalococcoidia bacterium]|jgi:adenylyltransferase/sulfurtransferase|nr:MAG: thiazole biosynthesis adenylyltransferase ThiF [Dehalococcoidia bacterium]